MDLASNLKTLKKDTPWDLKKVTELITEIAVNSKDLSVESFLPAVFSALDSAKQAALSKLVQEVSLNASAAAEVTKMFDELKVVAKFVAPAAVKSLTLRRGLFALSSCCSGVSVLKAIDQKASVVEEEEVKPEEEEKKEKKPEEKKDAKSEEEKKKDAKPEEEKKKDAKPEEEKKKQPEEKKVEQKKKA